VNNGRLTGLKIRSLFLSVVAFCIYALSSQSAVIGETKHPLAGVRNIYLEIAANSHPFVSLFPEELSSKGYVVVAEVSDADAVLKGTAECELLIDDRPYLRDPQDPLKCKYVCELLTKTNERIWKKSVKISGTDFKRMDKKAATHIAAKLDKAIKSSLRKQQSDK
jgi:hypothetical protein